MHVLLVGSPDEFRFDGDGLLSAVTTVVVDGASVVAIAGGETLARIDPANRPAWYELLTRISLARDKVDAARAWSHRCAVAARATKGSIGFAFAQLAIAHVEHRTGDASAATAHALRAARIFEQRHYRVDAARAVRLAAEASGAASTGGDANASAAAAVPESALRSLTARERQVALLVAHGNTNKAIAEELFLSVKTVERHLSRIFEKTGISSRTTLAVMVAREDTAQRGLTDS